MRSDRSSRASGWTYEVRIPKFGGAKMTLGRSSSPYRIGNATCMTCTRASATMSRSTKDNAMPTMIGSASRDNTTASAFLLAARTNQPQIGTTTNSSRSPSRNERAVV
uniref:Uncharacterized protein n=1 Tax=Steinernema glaseri TaxID=37863 RepID=A0A1I7Z5T8_9BILA